MASVYETAIMINSPGTGPVDHYRLDETSGTVVTNYGVSALNATTNGTVTRGFDTLLAGDPLGRSTYQNKDTVLATRGDNVTFDRPATTTKLTLLMWYRPDDLRLATVQHALVSKGATTFGVSVIGSSLLGVLDGVSGGNLVSDSVNLIVPNNPIFVAMTFDGVAMTWKLLVNGVVVGQRALPAGQVVNHAAGGTLQIGGYNAFGATGIHGRIQHVTVFNAQAMVDSQIQSLYQLGVEPIPFGSDDCMYVFPWNRQVVAPGGAYKTIQFHNTSPWPVFLSQGGVAAKGAGILLAPRTGRLAVPSKFKGGWSAILDSRYGHAPLAIEKTY